MLDAQWIYTGMYRTRAADRYYVHMYIKRRGWIANIYKTIFTTDWQDGSPQIYCKVSLLFLHTPASVAAWVNRWTFSPPSLSLYLSSNLSICQWPLTVLYSTVLYCTVLSIYGEARPGEINPPKVDLCGESHGHH